MYRCKSSNYVMIGTDMRNTKMLETLLNSVNEFSDSHFSLLISEVVLTYMAVNRHVTIKIL